MKKRFKQSDLHKYLHQDVDRDDVLHSHAYRKVGKKQGPSLPKTKRASASGDATVSGYKNSMVGSVAQYHDKTPVKSDKNEAAAEPKQDEGVVGNRPKSSTSDASKRDKHSKDKHHFSEPPKRNFYRFD